MVNTFALLFHYIILFLAYLEQKIRNSFLQKKQKNNNNNNKKKKKKKKKKKHTHTKKTGILFESVIMNSCFHLLIRMIETFKYMYLIWQNQRDCSVYSY